MKSPKSQIHRIVWLSRKIREVAMSKGAARRRLARMKRLYIYKTALNDRLQAELAAERSAIPC